MTLVQPISEGDNQTPAMFLHQNIRLLRKKLNLSQEELAFRVGLNRGNIASYEKGTAEPRICNLLKLSEVFGVSAIDLAHRDLSCAASPEPCPPLQLNSGLDSNMQQIQERAEEITAVINSLYTCFQFKIKSLPEASPEILALQVHFDQMREAAQALIQDHLALIDHIRQYK
jgi:transcriptional regulator with XRE-family HTH domain